MRPENHFITHLIRVISDIQLENSLIKHHVETFPDIGDILSAMGENQAVLEQEQFNQVLEHKLEQVLKIYRRTRFLNRLKLDEALAALDVAHKIAVLQRISFKRMRFENGITLPADVLALLEDPKKTELALQKDHSPKSLLLAIKEATTALAKRKVKASLNADELKDEISQNRRFFRGITIVGVQNTPLHKVDLASAKITQDFDLRGKDCRRANFNAMEFSDEEGGLTVFVDSGTQLSGLRREGLYWGHQTKLHYTQTDWTFENPKQLFEAFEKAYYLRRKKEWFKWTDYFGALRKKYGEENFEAKLFEVLCHVQDKPNGRTAKIYQNTLKAQRIQEQQHTDYQQLSDEVIHEQYGDSIQINWNVNATVTDDLEYYKHLQAEFESHDIVYFKTVKDCLPLYSQREVWRSRIGGLVDENPVHPALSFLQLQIFLQATITEFKKRKTNISVARAHIKNIMAQINRDEFVSQYLAYQEYLETKSQVMRRVNALKSHMEGKATAPDFIFSNEQERKLFSLKHAVECEKAHQIFFEFYKNLMRDGQIDWQFLKSKQPLFYQFSQLYLFFKEHRHLSSVNEINLTVKGCERLLLDKINSLNVGFEQWSQEYIVNAEAAICFIKHFDQGVALKRVADALQQRKLLLQRNLMFGDSSDKAAQRKAFNTVVNKFGLDCIVDENKNDWVNLSVTEQYQLRLAQFLMHINKKALDQVDRESLKENPAYLRAYDQLEMMRQSDSKLSYISKLIGNGYWQDAKIEYEALGHVSLNEIDSVVFTEAITHFSSSMLNQKGELDKKKVQEVATFLRSDFAENLAKQSEPIAHCMASIKRREQLINQVDTVKSMIKAACEGFGTNHTETVFSLLAKLNTTILASGNICALILTNEEKDEYGRILGDQSQCALHKREITEILIDIIKQALSPNDLLNDAWCRDNAKLFRENIAKLYSFILKHQDRLGEVQALINAVLPEKSRYLAQEFAAMRTQYFLKADSVQEFLDKACSQPQNDITVYFALESVRLKWQLIKADRHVSTAFSGVFARFDNALACVGSYQKFDCFPTAKLHEQVLNSVGGLVDDSPDEWLTHVTSYLQTKYFNAGIEPVLFQKYACYLYLRVIVDRQKQIMLDQSDDLDVIRNCEMQVQNALVKIGQLLQSIKESVTLLGTKKEFYSCIETAKDHFCSESASPAVNASALFSGSSNRFMDRANSLANLAGLRY